MLKEYLARIKKVFGPSIDVRRDWIILCAIFLVLVVLVLLIDVCLFYADRFNVSGIVESLTDGLKLNQMKLDKITDDWRIRELNYNRLLEERETIVDPSL